jgi:peptidase C39-like protein
MSDLFAATSRLSPAAVSAAVPPGCRRPVEAAPAAERDGADQLVTLGEWRPGAPSTHFLPAFAVLSPSPLSVRFELAVRITARWSAWVGTATLGPATFHPLPTSARIGRAAGTVVSEIDVVTTSAPVDAVRLRVRIRAADPRLLATAAWMVSLSASGAPAGSHDAAPVTGARLAVPACSQLEQEPAIARRICSPVSVAMVLGYWRRQVAIAELAAELLHRGLDLYGVWPAAILAAGRRGLAGYLLRFPGWDAAAWCLEHGYPIVASVRYGAGELPGAPLEATPGHLLVLTGYEDDDVLINDPAAPDAASVPRRYRRRDVERIWLTRAGVGYVIFDPHAGA